MAFPGSIRAWITAGLVVLVGAAAMAQSTQPATAIQQADRAVSAGLVHPGARVAPLVPGQRVRISQGGVVQVTNGPAMRTAAGGDAPKYADGVYRVAEPSDSLAEPRQAPTTRDEASEPSRGASLAGDNWYDRWQSACGYGCGGYGGYVPAMIYPDDMVYYGGRSYGRALEAGNRAGIDIGRRETLFKGALDMYNERMGNPPASPNGAAGDYYGGGYPYPVPPSWDAYSSGYRAGQYEAELWLARDRNLIRTSKAYTQKGQELFRAGKYEEAAEAFRLAASSDHGDAASRLLAAHAYFAVGRYGPAMAYLRRAFELQPKIAFLDYSIHAGYGTLSDFDKHLSALKKACEEQPRDYQTWALLGYVCRHSGDRQASTKALTAAFKIEPRDKVVRSLLDVDLDPRK